MDRCLISYVYTIPIQSIHSPYVRTTYIKLPGYILGAQLVLYIYTYIAHRYVHILIKLPSYNIFNIKTLIWKKVWYLFVPEALAIQIDR